jgi:hypothetical protein
MVRKPVSGDSEQREREAERARKQSQLSAGSPIATPSNNKPERRNGNRRPMHGSSDGESAHGALPRKGIEFETSGDD